MGILSRADDEDDFRAFALGEQPHLFRMALVLTRDAALAEDLAQTALMRTYAHWSHLKGDDALRYARRILVNANIDRWRRHRGREQVTETVPDRPGDDPAPGVVERDAMLRALAELTTQERRIVVLRFLADLSENATAEQLGIPIGTVKSATHRAIAKLRTSSHLATTDEVKP